MTRVGFTITMSVDGFVAGPEQSVNNPLGIGGTGLHEWSARPSLPCYRYARHATVGSSTKARRWRRNPANVGATIMGRNMFGGHRAPGRPKSWDGWWGDDPPFHHPVFVLTHHARAPLAMKGGTTFHFVTDGIQSALDQARRAAGAKDVALGGGASAARQYLNAGLVDEMDLTLVPILLGSGERLFANLDGGPSGFECVELVSSPAVAHYRYVRRVG